MESLKEQLELRRGELELERSSWIPHWQELSEYILPRSGRFLATDGNDGQKKHNSIYDNTGTRALRVLGAGLLAGMTSPARPWFRLATPDPDLMESDSVKRWLHLVTQMMLDIFSRSNTYRALHGLYEELGCFGTGAVAVLPSFENVIHMHSFTTGEYMIAVDYEGQVNTLYRRYQASVLNLVREFGIDNVSSHVKGLYESRKGLHSKFEVVHAIEPRYDFDSASRVAKKMPWKSVYYELGGDEGTVLRESGFKRFPILAPRWATAGGDIYGNSPGMESLGDIKQLQHAQFRKSQGIDYMVEPPMTAPSSAKGSEVNLLPGGVSYVDSLGQGKGLQSALDARIDLQGLVLDIQDIRERIRQSFFADLFLMLANDQRSNITAREVAERHEEKLLMLGPVLERLHNELLSPLIDATFNQIVDANILPTPPRELADMDLKVEFVSVLAQAQKAVGLASVDRLLGTVNAIAAGKPEVLDKIDADQTVDRYAEMLGVDPTIIVSDDAVAEIRAQRAQQAQAMQMAAMAKPAADAATAVEKLGNTPTGGDNALASIMNQFAGYGG